MVCLFSCSSSPLSPTNSLKNLQRCQHSFNASTKLAILTIYTLIFASHFLSKERAAWVDLCSFIKSCSS